MYYLAQNNEKTGPFTLEQLRAMWREGAVYPQTLYWEDGMGDWQPLGVSAAGRLGLAPVGDTAAAPAAFPVSTPDAFSPPSTSQEPSAYDLPVSRLPAGPVTAPTPRPASAGLPTATGLPGVDAGPLIAPTRLPGAGAAVPAGYGALTTGTSNEMPPAAYLSLVFSILGPFAMLFHLLGWLLGMGMIVAAIVCGHSARAAIKGSGGRLPGWGIATAGMILGYLSLALGLLVILVLVGFLVLLIYGMAAGHHVG